MSSIPQTCLLLRRCSRNLLCCLSACEPPFQSSRIAFVGLRQVGRSSWQTSLWIPNFTAAALISSISFSIAQLKPCVKLLSREWDQCGQSAQIQRDMQNLRHTPRRQTCGVVGPAALASSGKEFINSALNHYFSGNRWNFSHTGSRHHALDAFFKVWVGAIIRDSI